jgi:hypothetical protein
MALVAPRRKRLDHGRSAGMVDPASITDDPV